MGLAAKSRLGHSKRDRRHKSPGRQDSTTTDYAADLSSDHSTPSSTQSPRHRLYTRTALLATCIFPTEPYLWWWRNHQLSRRLPPDRGRQLQEPWLALICSLFPLQMKLQGEGRPPCANIHSSNCESICDVDMDW
ncbi:hypothetical protein NQ315_009537 [Exocentrus adspersus]|uniref:Uncharacterized protein n=1 Tax=Exocentrus adspersus TaxID=1586481 RepID=A0AAV8WG15_9CUCU|nr:hypothetical protein NQ315_009537 [Exocentrus adspersus]